MINFQPNRDEYRYATGTTGKVLEVDIDYQLGGANFLSGTQSARGIYISFQNVTINEHSRSYTLFGGGNGDVSMKCLLMELKRKSAKQLIIITEELDRQVPALAELAKTDVRAACQQARSIIEAWKTQAAAA